MRTSGRSIRLACSPLEYRNVRTTRIMTIWERIRPVVLVEAVVLGFFIIVSLVPIVMGRPECFEEDHVFWTFRGCLIGPVELLINPFLTQAPEVHIGSGLLMGVIGLGMICVHIVKPSHITKITSVLGTLIWILCGLGAAWAWR